MGDPGAFHHATTHSFGFGLIFTVVVTTILTKTWKRFAEYGWWRLASIGLLLYISHLLVDLVTLDNSKPFGMPLAWPISNEYIHAPIYVFPNVLHSVAEAWSLHNLNVIWLEVLVLFPPLVYLAVAHEKLSTPVKRLWGLATMSYVGVVLALLTRSNPYF